MTDHADVDPVLVVTSMPLSKQARADLSEMLGTGYVVVDIKVAPPTANLLLTPVVSGQLLVRLRRLFPEARILFTELHDDGRGISLLGPLSSIVSRGPDGYFVAHTLESLAPIVQSEARLQLTGSKHPTPPRMLEPSPRTMFQDPQHTAVPAEQSALTGCVILIHDHTGDQTPPRGHALDLAPFDSLVARLTDTSDPRSSLLWPALVAESAVHLERITGEPILVDVRGLDPVIKAELQIRVASDFTAHSTWPPQQPGPSTSASQ